MKETKYRMCSGSQCESFTDVAANIQNRLGLEKVSIDPASRVLSYENPRNCRVDERLLEEAASNPGKKIEFEICA